MSNNEVFELPSNFEDMDDGILIIGEESIAKKQNTNLFLFIFLKNLNISFHSSMVGYLFI